jgi:NAD(P)-dependent dehydrogenase (short-subunit alcohol dehydrogenase family)
MTHDQYAKRDPTRQHAQPDMEDQDQQEPPGTTAAMADEPDHGESTYRGSGRLAGKKAVITGGDSGIGRAVALAFAREGADVAVAHLEQEQSDADETARLVKDSGRQAVLVAGDLTDEDQCRRLIERAVAELGTIDVLVNNAAYQMAQPDGIEAISTEQLDRVLKTNLYAMFWLCKMGLRHMRPGSAIINTSSIQASQPSPELLDYAVTKAGIVNFTKGLAAMLAPRGIRVNAVAPGPIWTPLIPATMPDQKMDSFGEQTPLGRAGQPAELAPAYVFLASQESSYVTGEVIAVTGGMPM